MAEKGGRMPASAYGRPAQAKGVGKNAKRHDLERPKTPGLHGSDLQQGDVQALEQGQRVAPPRTQQSAAPIPPPQQGRPQQGGPPPDRMEIPDAIDFLAQRQPPGFELPRSGRQIDNSTALTWLPILRQLASGPGASGKLAAELIRQARLMRQAGGQAATFVDLDATDAGIEAMLDGGLYSDFQQSHTPVPMPTGEADPFTEGPGQPGLGRQNPKAYRPAGPGTA